MFPAASSAARPCILLVDDAPANIDVLVGLLQSDYDLKVANRGAKALKICETSDRNDMILLDIMMPEMDGFEVCLRLRRMPRMADVPIMFLSALGEVQSKTRGFEVGANDYLTKPFEGLEVRARVQSLLKAKAYNDAVKEQIASELRIAREIQMGMLPHDFAGMEQTYRVELGAVLEPAREVGGDLYGACAAGPERLVLFLGDVSGKGLPASMFMVRAVSVARLLAREIAEPERILARLNDELAVDNPSGMFVTFLCAMFDPGSGRLVLANAGHCRPVLLRAGEPPDWAVKRLGTALGFEPGLEFERTDLILNPGDTLVFYTDGVIEAFNAQEECYGSERLLADAGALVAQSVPAMTAGLLRKVHAFAGGAPQSDDVAILILRVAGAPVERGGSRLTLELHATPQEVMRAVEALQEFGRTRRVDEKTLFGLALALEECGSNIVNHACQRDARQIFWVTFDSTGSGLNIELRDRGPEFDPTRAPAGADPTAGEEAEPGGWGLQLVRRYTDEIRHTRENGENVLRLTKQLSPIAGSP